MKSKSFFKKLLLNRKRSFEFFLPFILIILSVTAYLVLSQRKEARFSYPIDFRDQTFINALYHYRLDNLERAELLFKRALRESKLKRKKSLAELFLGNIYFKRKLHERAIEHYERAFTLQKRNVYALSNTALAYAKIGEIKQALSYAKKAYTMKRNLSENLLLLGNLYFALERFEEALSVYRSGGDYLDVFPYNCAVTHTHLGDLYTSKRIFQSIVDNQEANAVIRGLSFLWLGLLQEKNDAGRIASLLEKALEVFPSSDILRYNLSVMLLKGEQYERAVTLLKALGEAIDGKGKLLGFALYKSGRFREALDHYNTKGSIDDSAVQSYIFGDLYVKMGLLQQAKPFYEEAIEDLGYEGALINLFRIYVNEGLYENAKGLCYQFMKSDKKNPLPHILLADVLFQEDQELQARSHLKIAVDLSIDEISSVKEIAEVWKKHGHFNNALLLYHKILALDPNCYEAAIRIAEIYLLTGHKEKAKATFDKARQNISEIGEYYRVSILLAGCEEIQNALSIYTRLIDDFPYKNEAYYNLSILYLETGDYEQVIQTVRQCMETVPNLDNHTLSNLYSILGIAQIKLGRVGDAAKQFQEAKRLDNTNEIPVINLRRIDYLLR